jgi:hypothetical protein
LAGEPLATGYTSPYRAQGTAGFAVLLLFAILFIGAGLAGGTFALVLIGVAGILAAAGGALAYWRAIRGRAIAEVHPDRLEFVRGPQRGTLRFDEITQVRMLQWNRSLFPPSRGHRVLAITTGNTDWQIGTEIAAYAEFQDAVLAAVQAFHSA